MSTDVKLSVCESASACVYFELHDEWEVNFGPTRIVTFGMFVSH